jgi:long-chain acyl-CoA synthetase
MTLAFYDQLLRDTANEREGFMAIPIIRHAVAEGVTRGLYLAFLTSAYHHVKHTCPLLGLALSRCGEADGVYRTGLLAYLDEEKGHEEWILDDIEALGGDRRAVRAAPPAFPVRMMVAYANHAIERISPYALLGMVHVLEGMSVALARAAAASIGTSLGVDPAKGGFSYLTSHGHLDEDHVALFAQLLAQVDDPGRRSMVIQAAKDFYRLYGDIFRELSHAA